MRSGKEKNESRLTKHIELSKITKYCVKNERGSCKSDNIQSALTISRRHNNFQIVASVCYTQKLIKSIVMNHFMTTHRIARHKPHYNNTQNRVPLYDNFQLIISLDTLVLL